MKSISCPLCCNSTFANQQDLKVHLLTVVSNVRCPICCSYFDSISVLIDHLDDCSLRSAKHSLQDSSHYNLIGHGSQNSLSNARSFQNQNCTPREYVNLTDAKKRNLHQNPAINDNGSVSSRSDDNQTATNDEDEEDEEEAEENGNSDDDDVEGFYCTVCKMKIMSIEEHIQKFHTGQEVILQDDDFDADEEDIENPVLENGNKNLPSDNDDETVTVMDKTTMTMNIKKEPSSNGKFSSVNKKLKNEEKSDNKNSRPRTNRLNHMMNGEHFFCTICAVSFQSVDDHMHNYHNNREAIFQDIQETLTLPLSDNSKVDSKLNKVSYKCPHCNEEFESKPVLSNHLLVNHGANNDYSEAVPATGRSTRVARNKRKYTKRVGGRPRKFRKLDATFKPDAELSSSNGEQQKSGSRSTFRPVSEETRSSAGSVVAQHLPFANNSSNLKARRRRQRRSHSAEVMSVRRRSSGNVTSIVRGRRRRAGGTVGRRSRQSRISNAVASDQEESETAFADRTAPDLNRVLLQDCLKVPAFKCCGDEFDSVSSYIKHREELHLATDDRFQCNDCQNVFVYRSSFKIHLKTSCLRAITVASK